MSYSNIISVVSNSASKMFNERIDGQETHDEIGITNLMQTWFSHAANKTLQMDNIKVLQSNCRGLENKIHELFLFLKKENIDIVCLIKVKKWQKPFAHKNYFNVTEAKASSFHGSVIIAKKGITVKEIRQITTKKTVTDRH